MKQNTLKIARKRLLEKERRQEGGRSTRGWYGAARDMQRSSRGEVGVPWCVQCAQWTVCQWRLGCLDSLYPTSKQHQEYEEAVRSLSHSWFWWVQSSSVLQVTLRLESAEGHTEAPKC